MDGQTAVNRLWNKKLTTDALATAAIAGLGYKGLTWAGEKTGLIDDTPGWLDAAVPVLAAAGSLGYNALPSRKAGFKAAIDKIKTEGMDELKDVSESRLQMGNMLIKDVLKEYGPDALKGAKFNIRQADIPAYALLDDLKIRSMLPYTTALGAYAGNEMFDNPVVGGIVGAALGGGGSHLWDKSLRKDIDPLFKNPLHDPENASDFLRKLYGISLGYEVV